MNYSDYKIEDWVTDDDFIAYVNGVPSDDMDRLKKHPAHSENIQKASELILGLTSTRPALSSEKLEGLFNRINQSIDEKEAVQASPNASKPRVINLKWFGIAAAVAAAIILAFPYFTSSEVIHNTSIAERNHIKLPDNSIVQLNSVSSLTYDAKKWTSGRSLILEGEAYFDVETGSKFSVESPQGVVTVLGTQFNVRDRAGVYEVECLEGRVEVQVQNGGGRYILEAGDRFNVSAERKALLEQDVVQKVDWLANYVEFRDQKIGLVLEELSRHYEVNFENLDSISNERYTGFFSTTSLDSAMQQIFWPLGAEFEIDGDKVIIK